MTAKKKRKNWSYEKDYEAEAEENVSERFKELME